MLCWPAVVVHINLRPANMNYLTSTDDVSKGIFQIATILLCLGSFVSFASRTVSNDAMCQRNLIVILKRQSLSCLQTPHESMQLH